MIKVVILGFLVGLDNLQVVSGIGLFDLDKSKKWKFILSFAFFEMSMPLVGLAIGSHLELYIGNAAQFLGPLILFVLGSAIIVMELLEKDSAGIMSNSWTFLLLPFFMSFDNLFAGIGLGTLGYPVLFSALIIGLFSGILSFIGLYFGSKIRAYLPQKVELMSGAYMIALAIFFLVFD